MTLDHAYGYALLTKLCLVALVFGLGAWNWRRQRRRLGSEEAAHRIRRSAAMELAVATLVLVVTAILVSLPSPKPPRPPGSAAPVAAPGRRAHLAPLRDVSFHRQLLTPRRPQDQSRHS
jgi:hypothetical protein